jgi:hypothetical protein
MNKKYFVFILLAAQSYLCAQNTSENWLPVSSESESNLFINISGLSSYTGDDIYVWTQQEYTSPITMEEVDGRIYKAKTYYLINKSLLRYSIQQIIYYDKKNNVIKHYGYEHDSENPLLKYNYPVFKNSDAEKILLKCLVFISQSAENK